MINLLFISNNPRAELLKVHFQQFLKIRIELLADFDQGLRDVFEKRPVVVCIQEEISGVTGESVARHIQLLLGGGSPKFILMHEGNDKARALPGLFSYLLDLSISFEAVCDTLENQLKSLLGTQWDTLYSLAPKQQSVDELQKQKTGLFEVSAKDNAKATIISAPPSADMIKPSNKEPLTSSSVETTAEMPEPSITGKREIHPAISSVFEPNLKGNITERKNTSKTEQLSAAQSKNDDDDTVAIEQLLNIFEESDKNRRKKLFVAGAILLILLIGVLCLFNSRFVSKKNTPPELNKQDVVHQPITAPVQPAISTIKNIPVPLQHISIPSFVPKSGYDPEFSTKKPGWFRYISKNKDYRLFYEKNSLRALQVLAIENSSISVRDMQMVIRELTGNEKYRIKRYEKKQGMVLGYGRLSGDQELLIYKHSTKGSISAFVITFSL